MRLLLVGHGYLGAQVARVYRDAGWDVVKVSLSGGDGVLACDVSDAAAVADLPRADGIVHCASSGRGGEDAYRRVFFQGARHLIAAQPHARMIFVSSSSVYGQVDGSIVTEESPADPVTPTGQVLRRAEELVLAAGGTVLRLAGIYGPGRSVVLRKFLDGQAIIEDGGERMLNQIHRDDAADACFHALARPLEPGIYNVVDSVAMTQRVLYTNLAEKFGLPMPAVGPRKTGGKRGWSNKRVSNAKLMSAGWAPTWPSFLDAAEGIAKSL